MTDAQLAGAAVALALVAGGCGDGDGEGEADSSRDSARAVAEEYVGALNANDTKRVCELYSEGYLDTIENDPDNEAGGSCATQTVGSSDDYEVLAVEGSGSKALATISCDDSTASDCSLPLVREEDGWKVDGSPSPND